MFTKCVNYTLTDLKKYFERKIYLRINFLDPQQGKLKIMNDTVKPKILITGATGNIGTVLTKKLSAKKIPFRVMVRSEKDKKTFEIAENVETVVADFDDSASVAEALENIERAFLLTPSSEKAEAQQINFVETGKKSGVKHIVKLSQWAATVDSPVRFLRYHAAVETNIKNSGIDFTFLRPNLFMQNLLGFKEPISKEGKFFADAEDCRVSIVDVRDIASVAVAALTEDGHTGKIYDITGPEALTHSEMAEKLSAVLGKKIEYVDLPPEKMRELFIKVGFPVWQADGLLEDFAHYRKSEAAAVASGVKEAIGKQPFSFDDFARDYADIFRS